MPANTSRGYTYPLYTDPMNFPAQMQDLATDIDGDMQTLFNRIATGYQGAACAVEASGVNQAVANNADVAATFTTELYDNAGMVNLGVSTTTITFPSTGLYMASGRSTFLSNGGGPGARLLNFTTTGTFGIVGRRASDGLAPAAGGTSTAVHLTAVFFTEGGTTMTMIQRQNSGASLNSSTRQLYVARLGSL